MDGYTLNKLNEMHAMIAEIYKIQVAMQEQLNKEVKKIKKEK